MRKITVVVDANDPEYLLQMEQALSYFDGSFVDLQKDFDWAFKQSTPVLFQVEMKSSKLQFWMTGVIDRFPDLSKYQVNNDLVFDNPSNFPQKLYTKTLNLELPPQGVVAIFKDLFEPAESLTMLSKAERKLRVQEFVQNNKVSKSGTHFKDCIVYSFDLPLDLPIKYYEHYMLGELYGSSSRDQVLLYNTVMDE